MRYLTILFLLLFAVPVVADDGELFRKDLSKTPPLRLNMPV